MTMAKLTIRVVPGPVTTGAWCPECALPSAVECSVYWLRSSGVTTLATVRYCTRCLRRVNVEPNSERDV